MKQQILFESMSAVSEIKLHKNRQAAKSKPKLHLIDLNLIHPNPAEPRKAVGQEEIRDFANSIQRNGLLVPVLVRGEADGTFTVLAGSRRLKAYQRLGHKAIEALVVEGDPLQTSLIENIVRENLNPVDEAEALEELRSKQNFTLQELSLMIGKSKPYLSEFLSLTTLPDTIKAEARMSKNPPRKNFLVELAREKDPKKLMKLWNSFGNRKTFTVKSLREKRGKSGSTLSYKGDGYVITVRFEVKEISRAQLLKAIDEGRRNLLKRIQEGE